jgi:zinc protease
MQLIHDRTKAPEPKDFEKISIQEAEKSLLPNGIPLYKINAGFQDVVKIELLFPTTGFDEKQPLLSSATNRLLSEGTSRHTSQQLAEMIDAFGAFYETDETADYCSVTLFTLNKYVDETLPLLFEMVTDPVFPENELGVFRQNNRQRVMVDNEKVKTIARKKFNQVLFGGKHPYGYFVMPEDYDQLQRDSIQRYYKRAYQSAGCSILVSGKVTTAVVQSIGEQFGKSSWNNSSADGISSASFQTLADKKIYIEKKDAVQSALRIGKKMFNKTDPDYIGMTVLNTVLGGYFGSRLMSNIREDKGYTYSIRSAMVSMKEAGSFFISTEVGADVTQPALDEIYLEIQKLQREPVENYELRMVKNFMTGSFLKGIDGAFNLADRWKSLFLYGLTYDYYYKYLETIRTITPDELQQLAVKHLDLEGFYEIVAGKK